MRRLLSIIGIVATSILLTSAQLIAAEDTYKDEINRNECLLVSKNCTDNVDSIQQRIDKLNKEILKGTDVYTRGELENLKGKLRDTEKALEFMEYGG